jgi:hypothetical protein
MSSVFSSSSAAMIPGRGKVSSEVILSLTFIRLLCNEVNLGSGTTAMQWRERVQRCARTMEQAAT